MHRLNKEALKEIWQSGCACRIYGILCVPLTSGKGVSPAIHPGNGEVNCGVLLRARGIRLQHMSVKWNSNPSISQHCLFPRCLLARFLFNMLIQYLWRAKQRGSNRTDGAKGGFAVALGRAWAAQPCSRGRTWAMGLQLLPGKLH